MPTGVYKRTVEMNTGKGIGPKIKMISLCKCGCGEYTKPGNRFINGHHRRNIKLSEKIKIAISVTKTGVSASPAAIEANRVAQIKRWLDLKEHEKSKEVMNRPDVKARQIAAQTGVPLSPEHCKAISVSLMGDKNPKFIDGLSNINHLNFNESFRKKIRDRDIVCQLCGKTHEENMNETGESLSVHHIYYDPETNGCLNNEDFITLCKSCHTKTTSGDHEYWENYFIMQKLLVA